MSQSLEALVAHELERPSSSEIAAFAARLARETGAEAALFYGSVLRTGDLSGIADFYLLTPGPARGGWIARRLWPDVSYREAEIDGRVLRAKVATLPTRTFARAAAGEFLDTTIWTRFVQPAALAFAADAAAAKTVRSAVCDACMTAARYAAALGPNAALAADFWLALFRRTYRAELRVERPGREREILGYDPARYAALLPKAWTAAAIPFEQADGLLRPRLADGEAGRLRRAWRRREAWGKPLNALRLIKAASTFEGAARYAAWKIERHTGVAVPLTPLEERFPLLAAPKALWRLARSRR